MAAGDQRDPIGVEVTPIDRRNFDLKYTYALDKEFPIEFRKICELPPLQEWIRQNGKDELQIRLGKVIVPHRRRYLDSTYNEMAARGISVPTRLRVSRSSGRQTPTDELPYFNRIHEVIKAMHDASTAIDVAIERFRFVDLEHMSTISEFASKISDGGVSDLNAWNVHGRLNEFHKFLAVLTASAQLATGVSLSTRSKGRPGYNHLWPTWALVDLWEEFSGAPLKTPKRLEKGRDGAAAEFVDPSAEFVRLGLSLIDPSITGAAIISAIRSQNKFRKELSSKIASLEPALKDVLLG